MRKTRNGSGVGRSATIVGVAGALVLGAAGGVLAHDAFPDVGGDHPFHDDIGWMADTGVSEGYSDGTYRPVAPVTRQAMSAFMRRLAGHDPDVDPVVDAATVQGLTPDELRGEPGPQGPAGPAGPPGEAAPTSFAVVSATGDLVRGSGAEDADQVNAPGEYEVRFDRDVSGCAYTATIGGASTAAPPAGHVAVASRFDLPEAVFVQTRDPDGEFAERGFHLVVTC